ncbi:BEN domain-containing protein 7 isoform X2 [Xyrauchen texanus]|uniref:BEN domain-containing protein 7 isoform X2 n=1 Tax=Xyrauchen texanus TaxID=154827 RepID=UPI002241FC53|nr:BEN domain-containing protein 7 isoform X2 [Xyrauchen texanus]
MEFVERKRSRKSKSFKLVSDADFSHELDDVDQNDSEGDLDASETEVWLGDDGMEIKRQITGMMRLLSDKTGRVYQRVGREGETLKKEPQEEALSLPVTQSLSLENLQYGWSSGLPLEHGQNGTHSKNQRVLNHSKAYDTALPAAPAAMATEPSCCMCNCKSTLQAILLELRTMRKLIQTQRGTQDKQGSHVPISASRSSISRRRSRKRRPGHRVTVLTTPTKRTTPPSPPSEADAVKESDQRERQSKEDTPSTVVTCIPDPIPIPSVKTPPPHYNVNRVQNTTEPEVQLAEDYDVFIPKAQLDSILLNYTRSGSLLFRKLVCAFFDDATLANSLPNGKRKRGLNDTRKGLDQNIVGAIKVFTEKYCTANGIEKLPGPRDWVQILQDQIKLARRRLKRAETASESNEILHRTCTDKTGAAHERTDGPVAIDTA